MPPKTCPLEMRKGLPKVEIIPMQVQINDRQYTYSPYRNLSVSVFYKLQRQDHLGRIELPWEVPDEKLLDQLKQLF